MKGSETQMQENVKKGRPSTSTTVQNVKTQASSSDSQKLPEESVELTTPAGWARTTVPNRDGLSTHPYGDSGEWPLSPYAYYPQWPHSCLPPPSGWLPSPYPGGWSAPQYGHPEEWHA